MEILRAFLQDQGIFPVREELLVQLVTSLTDKEKQVYIYSCVVAMSLTVRWI
jgi:hypothetical protein